MYIEKQSNNTWIFSRNTSKFEKEFDIMKIPDKSIFKSFPKLDFFCANKKTNWYLLSIGIGKISDFDY